MKRIINRRNMQKLTTLFLSRLSLLVFFISLSSCSDKCEGIDCLSQDAFEFTLKSESSGEDLLFGSNPQLTEDDIEVFYMKNGVEQTYPVQFGTRSVIVNLQNDVKEYYVRILGSTDIVKVQFQRTGSSECCPSTTQIDEITVNGAVTETSDIVILLR